MKKILIWETAAIIGGGQKMSLLITTLLKQKNSEYSFCYLIPGTGPLAAELARQNIPFYSMGNQTLPTGVKSKRMVFRYAWLSLKAIVSFLKIAVREKPDIIYISGPAALPWGAICGAIIRKPVVWHLHHLFLDGATKKLLNLLSSWQSVKAIISVSNAVANQIISPQAITKKRTIYNPVDVRKYASGQGESIFSELGLKRTSRTIILGHIGLLQPSKRQGFLIAMVEELKSRGYDAQVFFVGQARDENAAYELWLRQIAKDKGLTGSVHFMGQRSDVPDILQAIDVLVIPSIEGLSLAGLEAMAAGKPVVTISKGGSAELIAASQAGCCFEEDDVTQAATMVMMTVDSSRNQLLRESGQKFVRKCSYEYYSKRLEEVFREVCQ